MHSDAQRNKFIRLIRLICSRRRLALAANKHWRAHLHRLHLAPACEQRARGGQVANWARSLAELEASWRQQQQAVDRFSVAPSLTCSLLIIPG